MKQNQIKTVKKFFKQKVQKAHKQNGQKCVTMATHVPAFVKEAWASVNTMPDLAAFMSHEEEKEDKTGFKVSFNNTKTEIICDFRAISTLSTVDAGRKSAFWRTWPDGTTNLFSGSKFSSKHTFHLTTCRYVNKSFEVSKSTTH